MKLLEDQTDSYIWQRFQSGDKDAYALVFKRYYPPLYDYCHRISDDIPFTEDCLQNFFLYLIERRQSLTAIENIEAYLFVSFRRYFFRKLKKSDSYELTDIRTDIQYEEDDFELAGFSTEVSTELRKRINSLPWSQREALYLRYYNGLPLEEVALIMNMNYQSIANALYRALKQIRSDKPFLKILGQTVSLATMVLSSF